MEIFDIHHPLVFVFGLLGNLVSTGVFLAPMPTFIEICKRKSTMGFQSLPYVVSLFSALLWLYYAFIKGGEAFLLVTINALGTFIESIYIIVFLIYATPPSKKQTFKVLSLALVSFLGISLGTFFSMEGSIRVVVVGWICVGISICVFAAPLTIVFQVVKTKSVEFMPLPLSCFLTLSAMMWFAYGMSIMDICVTVPNVLGFVLGIIQMTLYACYNKTREVPKVVEKKVVEHIINIPIISSNSEVHPVDSRPSSSGSEAEEEKNHHDGGGGAVVELNKWRPVVVSDEPCGVEVVNVKPMETPPVLVTCAA